MKTAFLYGELTEELYMNQPKGFIINGRETEVCALKKSLYGLKQASRVWSEKFRDFLTRFGLTRSDTDHCFFYSTNQEDVTFILVYVDDGLIASNDLKKRDQIINYLASNFEIRVSDVNRFIGANITRNREESKIYIDQSDTITRALTRFNLQNCKIRNVPADPNSRLSIQKTPLDEHETRAMELVRYREAIGRLLYISIVSRPDIAFAVNQVAQHCQNPGPAHWNAVVRIFAYLKKTANYAICYDGKQRHSLIGYTVSDFAGDLNNRKSTSGFIFFFNGPFSWSSKLQRCVAQSTTEAEFIAASESSKEAVWNRRLLEEIGFGSKTPTTIFCDNQSAIALVHNPVFHQKTKHMEVKYYFIHDLQEKGEINMEYIDTANQWADIFTKPLPGPRFEMLREKIGVIPLPTNK